MSTRQKFEAFLGRSGLEVKQHQVDGVEWCVHNEVVGHEVNGKVVRGGLIADEMGLGKTIQMIGTMICNFYCHTLIVLPRALLEQWTAVIINTTGHVPLVYHGHSNLSDITEEKLAAAPIIVTTYGMVAKKTSPLHNLKLDRVVFDEAHHLRNSKTACHTKSLKLNSKIRWLITGTPIQNRKSDFYALCAQIGIPEAYYKNSGNLIELTRSFLLKRTKKQAKIELPTLSIETKTVRWESESEKELAEDIHSLLEFSNINRSSERHIDNKIAAFDMPTLVAMIRARQACIYPALMRKKLEHFVAMGLLEMTSSMTEAISGDSSCSSKLNAVVKHIIARKDNGNSKIIFCHYRGEIDELRNRLMRQDMVVETFDGRTPQHERERLLTTECDVLILQIQTGCEGLNLQHFSEIYFVSPHWNPAVEDQAIARCHRIGQTKETHVFRFTMSGFSDDSDEFGDDDDLDDDDIKHKQQTLEEYAIQLQDAKRELATMLKT